MTLMQTLLAAGYPRNQMWNHESDLYIYAIEKTRSILRRWYAENNLPFQASVFRSQIDGKLMYDCPFAFDDWWKERS